MKYKIEFGFGVGEDRNGDIITLERKTDAMHEIKRVAVELFGGYTLVKTDGGWKNACGRLVTEPGYTLVILVESDTRYFDEDPIKSMARVIKEQLFQEAVAVTVIEANWDFL